MANSFLRIWAIVYGREYLSLLCRTLRTCPAPRFMMMQIPKCFRAKSELDTRSRVEHFNCIHRVFICHICLYVLIAPSLVVKHSMIQSLIHKHLQTHNAKKWTSVKFRVQVHSWIHFDQIYFNPDIGNIVVLIAYDRIQWHTMAYSQSISKHQWRKLAWLRFSAGCRTSPKRNGLVTFSEVSATLVPSWSKSRQSWKKVHLITSDNYI